MRCCVSTRAQAVNSSPFVFTRQNLKVFHVPQFLAGSLARRTGPDSELGAFFPASTNYALQENFVGTRHFFYNLGRIF